MNKQLSPQDWQMLSEYLDGELSVRQKEKLEQRLRIQPELKAGLEELRSTRSLLRSVPIRKAPRNFTLSPELAPQKDRTALRLFPVFRFSAALATFLVALSFLIQLLPGFAAPPRPMMAASQPESAMQAEQPTPMIIFWYPMDGRGGGGGAAPEITALEAPAEKASEMAAPEVGAPVDEPPTSSLAIPTAGALEDTQVPQATPAPPFAALPEPTGTESTLPRGTSRIQKSSDGSTGPILGIREKEEQGAFETAAAPVYESVPQTISTYQWLQIFLAAAAVLTGLAALYFFWRASR